MRKIILTSIFVFCFSFLTNAQGYIKNQPSNTIQDQQLKELDKEEEQNYQPKNCTPKK